MGQPIVPPSTITLTEAEALTVRNSLSEAMAQWATHADELRSDPQKWKAAEKIEQDADAARALIEKFDALLPVKMRTPDWVMGKITPEIGRASCRERGCQ